MDYALLRNELLADPVVLGYQVNGFAFVAPTMTDQAAADKLNATNTSRVRRRADITPGEIWKVLDMADMPPLANNPSSTVLSQERRDLSWLEGLTNIDRIQLINDDDTDTQIKVNLARLFPAGTGTRNRLLALQTQAISRATEIGLGPVTAGDVQLARSKTGGW